MACSTEKAFREAPLIGADDWGGGIFELRLAWTGPAPLPGQFFMLRAPRSPVLLGRPISVFGWTAAPGSSGGELRFLVARRGAGTADLAALRPGDTAELTGPLGNTWPDPPPEGTVALVGGGIGLAPLAFLADRLDASRFDFYAGFRSRPYGLDDLKARRRIIAAEDGSADHQGRITDFLDPSSYAAVYACGPEAMLRTVAAACGAAGKPCYLSLERRMACGVGACLGCTVRTSAGNRRCCVDGPIFAASEVLFD